MTHLKSRFLFKSVILFLVLIVTVIIWNFSAPRLDSSQDLMGVLRSAPKHLKSFELIDQSGQLINENIFKGQWSFVFFGYTSCPDVCPTTLRVLNAVMELLGRENEALLSDSKVVFVSVDPKRDSSSVLLEYMTFFNKGFMGLTGDKGNIDNVTQQFGSAYMLEKETAQGLYSIAHTSAIFLVDSNARLVAAFSQPHQAETIVEQYKKIRAYILGND